MKEQGRARKERVCNNFFYDPPPPPPPPTPIDFGCQAFEMSSDEWLIPSGCKNGVGRQHTTIEFFFSLLGRLCSRGRSCVPSSTFLCAGNLVNTFLEHRGYPGFLYFSRVDRRCTPSL